MGSLFAECIHVLYGSAVIAKRKGDQVHIVLDDTFDIIDCAMTRSVRCLDDNPIVLNPCDSAHYGDPRVSQETHATFNDVRNCIQSTPS